MKRLSLKKIGDWRDEKEREWIDIARSTNWWNGGMRVVPAGLQVLWEKSEMNEPICFSASWYYYSRVLSISLVEVVL
jgi:hypothetical protein